MKKGYLLILGLIIFILSLSYASATDNDTGIVKQENCDLNSADVENIDNISTGDDSILEVNEDDASNLSASNNDEVVGIAESNGAVGLSSSSTVLTSGGSSVSNSVNVYKEPTKKQRTFYIGNFKAVLSKYQYYKLFKISGIEDDFFDNGYADYYYVGEKFKGYGISNSGLYYHIKVKTNKFVKVKVKMGNKVKYKKARVYMYFAYGAAQYGLPYRHMVFLSHNYNTPKYDSAKVLGKNAKYFSKCKTSSFFTSLKKAKLISLKKAYKKYGLY